MSEVVKKELKLMDNLNKLNLDEYKPLRDVVFENLRRAIVGKLTCQRHGSSVSRAIRCK